MPAIAAMYPYCAENRLACSMKYAAPRRIQKLQTVCHHRVTCNCEGKGCHSTL